ncbi:MULTISPECIES: DUF6418 domain-containing protein [unclassified Exiguobacterium]|uniref:DUF6418 domain-containing protein n=1 Tax=unclassified Exiguobacterium TaxID=2644629 RepID=UPI001BE7E1A8|nr:MULTISPECIES: DUF6418 domain-containing protein [unclassified Exiguobacterium]
MLKKVKMIDTLLIFFTIVMFVFVVLKTSYFFHTLFLFAYVFYLLWLFSNYKKFFFIFIFMILYMTSNIFGVYVIEINSNMYLSEIAKFSSNNNSLFLLIIYHVIFSEVLRLLYSKSEFKYIKVDSKSEDNPFRVIRIVSILIFIIVTVLYINVIQKPYFLLGIDRFLYEEYYLNSYIIKINNFIFYFLPVITCLILYRKNKYDLWIGYSTIALFSLYLIWIGHKFSMLLIIGYFVLLGLNFLINDKAINKYLGRFFLVVTCLLILVMVQSNIVYGRDEEENLDYLNARLAQQGQLWWALYGKENQQETLNKNISDETKTFYKLKDNEDNVMKSGMYKIMREVTPENIFLQKVFVKKSRYAYSTPASLYFYFGAIGALIFSALSAVVYFVIIKTLMNAVLRRQLLTMIVSGRMLFISHFVLMQSDFNKLFSIEVLFIILFFSLKYLINLRKKMIWGNMNV